jgi:hypothetical protein
MSAGLYSFTDQMTLNEMTVEREISHIWKVLQVGAKFLSFVTFSRVLLVEYIDLKKTASK